MKRYIKSDYYSDNDWDITYYSDNDWDTTYKLIPEYDSAKSFYGKAMVTTGVDNKELYSYNTLVAEISEGRAIVYGPYSSTTLRHIKEFLKQNGFKAEDKNQIIKDYGV